MKVMLSYGAGINSTAILALCKLGKLPWPDYIVFSDTGAEWPHTYQYLDYMERQGIRIIYLTGGNQNKTLIEYCREKGVIPSRVSRWCTDKFKQIPLDYFKRANDPIEHWLGIDAGESHRMTRKKARNKKIAPLIELGLDREGCKKVIIEAGWGIPQKSGCFICPYQNKRNWVELKRNHPELWKIAVELEQLQLKRNPDYTLVREAGPLEHFVQDLHKQTELDFEFTLDQDCLCFFD